MIPIGSPWRLKSEPYLGSQPEAYSWAVSLPVWLLLHAAFSTSTETRVACRSIYAHESIHNGKKYNSTPEIPNANPQ